MNIVTGAKNFLSNLLGGSKKNNTSGSGNSIISYLKTHTTPRTKINATRIRNAIEAAIRIDNPLWADYINLCEQAKADAQIKGLMRTRRFRFGAEAFWVVDWNNPKKRFRDIERMFKGSWFSKVKKYFIDTDFYAHSLLEFSLNKKGKLKVRIVPRQHVIPQENKVIFSPFASKGFYYDSEEIQREFNLIEIRRADEDDLGLFETLIPLYVEKKDASNDWNIHSEIYSKPIMVITTGDDKRREKYDERMRNAGGNRAMTLYEGEKAENINGGNKGQEHLMYQERMVFCNKEMAKVTVGQTLTTEEGSSRSQGEVHERVANAFLFADLFEFSEWMVEELIPFLIEKFGFKIPENARFVSKRVLEKEEEENSVKHKKDEATQQDEVKPTPGESENKSSGFFLPLLTHHQN